MKITVLGNRFCKDCQQALAQFAEKGVQVDFHDFADNMQFFREFLFLRDSHPLFRPVIENKRIGMPCMIFEDGTVTLNPQDVLDKA